jgi:ribosome biogenesis GTPase A
VTIDIRNWIKNIEENASNNVNKVLVGNKADMAEKRVSQYGDSISRYTLNPWNHALWSQAATDFPLT